MKPKPQSGSSDIHLQIKKEDKFFRVHFRKAYRLTLRSLN